MKKNKPTTYGDIRGYVKRVNGEPEDLDLKARLKECRALMAQKNETQARTQHQRNRNEQVSLRLRGLQQQSQR